MKNKLQSQIFPAVSIAFSGKSQQQLTRSALFVLHLLTNNHKKYQNESDSLKRIW
jgi:hypothetical protein